MNKSITTNGLPAIPEAKIKKAQIITSNTVQPTRPPDIPNEKRRRFTGPIITSRNIEQIQEANRKAAKKGGNKD